jgi:hypothetical protein
MTGQAPPSSRTPAESGLAWPTTERTVVELVVPGVNRKFWATAVDGALVVGGAILVDALWARWTLSTVALFAVAAGLWALLYVPATAVTGATPGRLVAGTRVVGVADRPLALPGLRRAILRWLILIPNATLAEILVTTYPAATLLPGYGAGTLLLTSRSLRRARELVPEHSLPGLLREALEPYRAEARAVRKRGWRAMVDVVTFALVVVAVATAAQWIQDQADRSRQANDQPTVAPSIPPLPSLPTFSPVAPPSFSPISLPPLSLPGP